jgi:hypothetical protein
VKLSGPIRSGNAELGSVHLVRDGQEWAVASAVNYPAVPRKVERLLARLAELKAGDVIAANAANHAALHVAEPRYDRRLEFWVGEERQVLYIGDGPRNSIHVRRGTENDVRAVRGLTAWSFRVDAGSYIYQGYLSMQKDDVTSLGISNEQGDLDFVKVAEEWQFTQLPTGRALHAMALESFVNVVTRVAVETPIGKEVLGSYGLDSGASIEVGGTVDGEPRTIRLRIGEPTPEGGFYAKSDESDYVVKISKQTADQILTRIVDHFLQPEH